MSELGECASSIQRPIFSLLISIKLYKRKFLKNSSHYAGIYTYTGVARLQSLAWTCHSLIASMIAGTYFPT